MKNSTLLTIATLVALLLATFHVAQDVVYGYEKSGWWNTSAFLIFTPPARCCLPGGGRGTSSRCWVPCSGS